VDAAAEEDEGAETEDGEVAAGEASW